MENLHSKSYPGETTEYRIARDQLLNAELELRRSNSAVTAMRATLPLGGIVPKDYIFESVSAMNSPKDVTLSSLFEVGENSLIVYGLMYASGATTPCPACTSILDGLNGCARHIKDRVNLAVVAKADPDVLQKLASDRGWVNLDLYSCGRNTFGTDYFTETPNGEQMPMLNVFRYIDGVIRHTYGTELLYVPTDEGQDPRHVDPLWPIWNMFDLTMEGRGVDWHPKLSYD